jgi:cytoskeletal protein CcmA (bactofilin family)
MKIRILHSRGASVLVSAAMSAGVLAILIAGVLTYLSDEYDANYRAHRWNQALHLSEAAVEIGMAELNYQYTQGGSGFQSSRNWTSMGGGSYSKTVANLANAYGNAVGTLSVTAYNIGTANPKFQGVGTVTSANYGGRTITRAVQVSVAGSSMFPVGLAAKGTIDLNGNNAYTDSFDSSDPTKSTGGLYDVSKRQANGNIGTLSTVTNSVGVGNADVYGTVATGPGGSVSIGVNGSVGSTFTASQRATSDATGLSEGWIRNDFSASIPDPALPAGAGLWTSEGNISGNTTLSGPTYYATGINLSGNKTLTISGNVTLYVNGSISLAGNAQITVASGASLTVYAAGSISLGGNGVVNNDVYASKDVFYGLSSCTSVSVAGNGSFVGAIYAPDADLTISGNGNVYGAVVAKSVTLNGNANVHYDESLKNITGSAGYLAASWQELRYVSGSWVP